MELLLAGGAGYIGSVICDCLIQSGHSPVIVDSLKYGNSLVPEGVRLYTGDIGDFELIQRIFDENPGIELCIHCAEIASPNLSVFEPFDYYHGNVVKSMRFLKYLSDLSCKRVVFCSSAAVYDEAPGQVATERSPIAPRNPFGHAKYMTETILRDFCRAYGMRGVVLRTFNAIGVGPNSPASTSGLRPNSIIYNLIQVMQHEIPYFEIAGDDWDTRDGTCIRDYIHIWDMALAHVKAAELFDEITGQDGEGYTVMNIGSGHGVTVREFISAFENVTGEKIRTQVSAKRPGDSTGVYANIERAARLLGWRPELPVEEAILGVLNALEAK